ncbi:uncharacterized protein LOC129263909 [Lytechinus pictus]|uniref:uncharacterized protein LOC129263909 n=1 Tax=Lytechinus pictus TaxID=7653 RepID=UPI0030BA1657
MADEQQQQQETPTEQESAPPVSPETQPAAEPEPETKGAEGKPPPLQDEMEKFRALGKTAFVAGYTGECGKALVQELARTKIFSKVFLIGRREVPLKGDVFNDFSAEQKVVDYDNLDASDDIFKGPSVGYCCLGTTRGKAGKEGFKKVDHDYVMKIGELAKKNGCEQYHLVSSMGANAKSSMLYPKVKVWDYTTIFNQNCVTLACVLVACNFVELLVRRSKLIIGCGSPRLGRNPTVRDDSVIQRAPFSPSAPRTRRTAIHPAAPGTTDPRALQYQP